MQIGVVFPQNEFFGDAGAIREFARAVEELGYSHVLAYDHVLGAAPTPRNIRRNGWDDEWRGPYSEDDPFHEIFTLFAYMAGIAPRLAFITGILVLPQRNAILAAKQAAELDILTGGSFRLGVGVGWNKVEIEAMGANPENRGRRVEEQVAVMQALWTQPNVHFEGRYHTLLDVGIMPLPVQRPIPVWFGGHAPQVIERIAKIGSGWLPGYRQAEQARPWLEKLDAALARQGRSRADIGIEPRVQFGTGDPEVWQKTLAGWEAEGARHASVNTLGLGYTEPGQHLAALRKFAENMFD